MVVSSAVLRSSRKTGDEDEDTLAGVGVRGWGKSSLWAEPCTTQAWGQPGKSAPGRRKSRGKGREAGKSSVHQRNTEFARWGSQKAWWLWISANLLSKGFAQENRGLGLESK